MVPMFDGLTESVKGTAEEMSLLGQILTGKQTAAVESMNVAFKNVYSTGQKIIGQVIGNMAPMIEAATEKLLDFVRAFKFDGEIGGNALAKAITEALIKGAIKLAEVFDTMVESFTSFLAGLKTFSDAMYDIAAMFGYTSSDSGMGKVWEQTIQDIDRQMGLLHKHLDIHNKNIKSGNDIFGANQKQREVVQAKIKDLESRRAIALESMNAAENQYHDEKKKAVGGMGGFADLIKAMENDLQGAQSSGAMQSFFDEAAQLAGIMPDVREGLGKVGQTLTGFLTDPSEAVGRALGSLEKGFWNLTEPLGLTPGVLREFADNLAYLGSPMEMVGNAGEGVLQAFKYVENSLGSDLVTAANRTAEGFLSLIQPMGYTAERILAMAEAARQEEEFKKSLISGAMNQWDRIAQQMADQYIQAGQNPFDVYRAMMEERNAMLNKVTEHFDGLQDAAGQTKSAMEKLAPSVDEIAQGIPRAVEIATDKITGITESIADYFGIGEDGGAPEAPEEKDYTAVLTSSESLLGVIADSVSGLGGLSLARIF